jgi:carboxyl-terminal processing protease
MKRKNIVLLGLVGFVAFLSGGWLLQRSNAGDNIYGQARMLDDVVQYVSRYYVDSISQSKLYDMAIDGMLANLKDPYTVFLRPDDLKELSLATTGNYGGLGIRIEVVDGWITVVSPLPGTPAEAAGIESGDRIVQLDGASTHDWSSDTAVTRLRGPKGSVAHLTIVRAGIADSIQMNVTREDIHFKSVQVPMVVDHGVGYVQLNTVSEESADELQNAIDSLRKAGARSVIFDLRNNPGGLLNQGIAVADLFLDRGEPVVETRGRAPDANNTYDASHVQAWPGMPVVVLVNGFTASAAEIIAGALQDHDRALVLGTTSFGKGLVQSVISIGPEDALKLTTGRWFTPSGRRLQRPAQDNPADQGGTIDVNGADTTVADSNPPKFYTDAGRVVYGGGGIKPDVTVRDTLTSGEQALAKAIGAKFTVFNDVLSTYALNEKGRGVVKSPDFTVTPVMVQAFRNALVKRGLTIPDSAWNAGESLVRDRIGYEIARYVFGRAAEVRREIDGDQQVQAALKLLEHASTPKDLFTLAQQDTKAPAER